MFRKIRGSGCVSEAWRTHGLWGTHVQVPGGELDTGDAKDSELGLTRKQMEVKSGSAHPHPTVDGMRPQQALGGNSEDCQCLTSDLRYRKASKIIILILEFIKQLGKEAYRYLQSLKSRETLLSAYHVQITVFSVVTEVKTKIIY